MYYYNIYKTLKIVKLHISKALKITLKFLNKL